MSKMLKFLIIFILFGMLLFVDSQPTKKKRNEIIFSENENDIVHILPTEAPTKRKSSSAIRFPDTDTDTDKLAYQMSSTSTFIDQALQPEEELPHEAPVRQLFLDLFKNNTSSPEFRIFKRAGYSILHFFEEMFFVGLRLSITALKSGAG